MREIKFRAWSNKKKKWIYLRLQGSDIVCYLENGKQTGEDLSDLYLSDWLQYTGLKDKNGKEIFEGDIWEEDTDVGEIIWLEDEGQFALADKNDTITTLSFLRHGYIIGNIYENKDLLK